MIDGGRAAGRETPIKYYNGLLSDILQVNNFNNLPITSQCNRELKTIQSSLNVKDVWAIKRK